VAAAPRGWNDVGLSSVCDCGSRLLSQPDLCIAAKWTEATAYSVRGREGRVEHGNAIEAMVSDMHVCELRINPIEGKGLQRGLYAEPLHLVGEPPCGRVIDLRSSAMVALGVVRLKQTRDALLKRIW